MLLLALAFTAVSAAQTFKSRAPAFERVTMERLRLSYPRSDPDRALVFPCKPAGQGCVANPLAAGRLVFEGTPAAWAGYELCRRTASGETCVPLERVFAR